MGNNYIEFALAELKKAGLKITKPRKMMVELLASSDKAFTPYEMRDTLKGKGINADVVTIYRVLEVLERMSLVHKVMALGRYIRCLTSQENQDKTQESEDKVSNQNKSLNHKDSSRHKNSSRCHHYLLCKKCRKVEEIEGENLHALEQKIQKEKKFQIEEHYLEFIGICAACQ